LRGRIWCVKLKAGDLLEDPGDGSIILRLIFKKKNGGVEWIVLDQKREKGRAVVSTVMNLQFQLCTTQGIS
jgi:hypothetical protein